MYWRSPLTGRGRRLWAARAVGRRCGGWCRCCWKRGERAWIRTILLFIKTFLLSRVERTQRGRVLPYRLEIDPGVNIATDKDGRQGDANDLPWVGMHLPHCYGRILRLLTFLLNLPHRHGWAGECIVCLQLLVLFRTQRRVSERLAISWITTVISIWPQQQICEGELNINSMLFCCYCYSAICRNIICYHHVWLVSLVNGQKSWLSVSTWDTVFFVRTGLHIKSFDTSFIFFFSEEIEEMNVHVPLISLLFHLRFLSDDQIWNALVNCWN